MNRVTGEAMRFATDCHVHVFDPERYPYAADRRYTPPAATVHELAALHGRLGMERVVLVQPSVYGTDNRCLVDALHGLGDVARGVAVLEPSLGDTGLAALHAAGVRGARLNLQVSHDADVASARERLMALCSQLGHLPWVIQLHAALPVILALADTVRALPKAVLLDHFASCQAAPGTAQPGFESLLNLLGSPNVHIKLSGPYQISDQEPGYADVAPGRVVWGSDWPHPAGGKRPPGARPDQVEPFRREDDARNLALLSQWASAGVVQDVLADAPARLFGFTLPAGA